MLIYILLILTILSPAQELCPTQFQPPAIHLQAQKELKASIEAFAKKPIVAQKADATLSQLLAAKSTIITSWLHSRQLLTQSESVIAQEWRIYYARNFILSQYPHKNSDLDHEIEVLVDAHLKKYLTEHFKKKMESLFKTAKLAALSYLESLNNKDLEIGKSRIQQIQLYWPSSLKTARNNTIPLDLIDWGVAYDPVPNEINVGINALMYPNDETFISVFSHEIGHSIDSCRWAAFLKTPWPFEKVGDCLRSEKTVGAKKRDDQPLEQMIRLQKVDKDFAASLKQNPTCNKLAYPPAGIQADQLPESFADWFSAEVIATQNQLDISNIRADLCEARTLNPGSSYPSHIDRLRKIYFAHPLLAQKKKLKSSPPYCPFLK